ncbi:MAG: RIP metalloprotease RseP [Sphingomonadales bacterium]|nr:RIP metalloprotease RseP [Sphingomonadales bacterium]
METISVGAVYSLLAFLVALTVLVFVHEMGHYLVARLFKVRVDVFSIGFGPEIWGRVAKSGTRWRISAIPLGGYVKFFGDMNAASAPTAEKPEMPDEDKEVCFQYKPLGQRAAIVAAGPIVNFVFAIVIFAGLFTIYGKPVTTADIATVAEGSAAERAGIKSGDKILTIDGDSVESFNDIRKHVSLNTGSAMNFLIERETEALEISFVPDVSTITDRFGNQYEVRRLGIGSKSIEVKEMGLFSAIQAGFSDTVSMTKMMMTSLGQIIMGTRSVDELGGPIKIAQTAGESASMGLVSFIMFMALISINLGMVNLFPIPVLDGGHLLFYGMEAVMGKPVSARFQEIGYMAGFVLFITLMIFLTWNDIIGRSGG